MADNQVLIEFVPDLSKMQPAIDSLKALGQVNDEMVAMFNQAKSASDAYLNSLKQGNEQAAASTKAVASSVDEFGQKLQDLGKKAVMGSVETEFKSLQTTLDKVGQTIQDVAQKHVSYRTRLRELREEMNQLDHAGQSNSEQFKKTALDAAKLEHQIQKTQERLAVMASPTKNIEALAGAIKGIGAGFEVALGAQSLFGTKSEELERTLLKVQGAMALVNGVREISNLLLKEEAAKVVIVDFAQKAFATTNLWLAETFGISAAAARGFAAALVATGIGAIVVALGYFVSMMMSAADATEEAKKAAQEHEDALHKEKEAIEAITKANEEKRNAEENGLNDAKRNLELAKATGASERELAAIKNEILQKELQNLRIRKATYYDDAEEQQKIGQQILDKETEILANRLEYQKKNHEELSKESKKYAEERKRLLAEQQKLETERVNAEIEEDKKLMEIKIKNLDEEMKAKEKAYKDSVAAMYLAIKQEDNANVLQIQNRLLDVQAGSDEELDLQKQLIAAKAIQQQNALDVSKMSEKEYAAAVLNIQKQSYKDQDDLDKSHDKKLLDDRIALEKKIAQESVKTIQTIANDEFKIAADNRKAILDAEIQSLETKKEGELSNTNLTASQKKVIEDKYKNEEAALKLKDWKAEQKAKEEQAIINGALAVTNILATRPKFDLGIGDAIMIAAAAISTAEQVRVISSAKPPAFAKGKNVNDTYQGMGLIGEAGRELRFDKDGTVKMYTKPTFDYVYKDTVILPNHQTEKLLATMNPRLPNVNMTALERRFESNNTAAIDYDKLGEAIAKKIADLPINHINIDENGFTRKVIQVGNETTFLNNRYSTKK